MDEAEREDSEKRLPDTAQVYLDIRRMGIGPDGKKLTVTTAARMAGVSRSTVQDWRTRFPDFRALERKAVEGWVKGYPQELTLTLVEGMVVPATKRMIKELVGPDGEWRAAWEVLKATGKLASVFELGGRDELQDLINDLRDAADDDDDMEDLDDLDGLDE